MISAVNAFKQKIEAYNSQKVDLKATTKVSQTFKFNDINKVKAKIAPDGLNIIEKNLTEEQEAFFTCYAGQIYTNQVGLTREESALLQLKFNLQNNEN